ncbi:hypothetical protein SLEP1_g45232 [Rubroshorea leprosula]|uniref:Integrase catalytic domain-containing protein n=1 Tax=Rubroshorea leprosula TaxID=152421 RepID=A0AAV5LK26_9ROSI|nr:hypothetical protein SLEP1_g45232 [Rubroshorea leprosula]
MGLLGAFWRLIQASTDKEKKLGWDNAMCNGVWESVEDGFHPLMLPNNPTVAQMKQHADYVQASYKALSYIHSVVTDDIFSRIMGAETTQEAWDTLKKEFDGSSRVKDKFESKISTIKESCDLKELTITDLISKLQAHEQRLVMKTDETTEGAFLARQKGKQLATSSESNKTMAQYKPKQQQQVNYAEDQCKEDYLFTMSQGSSLPSSSSFVDSGCTNHMARDENFFIEIDKSVITNVKLGNGNVVRSQGKGTAVIQTKIGKMHKLPFPVNKSFRATQKLELVHTDIRGPMRTPSLSQNRYFILFIDDFTRMTWVYFLGSKGQALPVFKKFKALVENQSGCRIKKLRSDNGKEYTSNDFNLFCEEAGVDHQLTVSYTPQQNGIAERKNRTVMEMARCMLAEKKLPKCFWAEAVYTAVYLLNGLPTKAVKGMTPIERKLDEKAEIGIFIGYATQAKGYKVYDLISKKVNVHKDVVFDKSAHWNWDAGKIEKEVDDDSPVLKTKSLVEIYARCNLASAEPNCFKEVAKQQPIGVKWVFRTKLNPDGSIHKHKARLVVKGYAQQPGVDYGETYALVARHDTVRLLIALAANLGWKLFHMDVKSAFLNGVLPEEIYVEQPPGFEITGKEDCVYKLNKALYGLKQAPRAWYCRIDHYLMSQGFRRSTKEATLYVKGNSSESQLILSLYVDDLLLTGNDLKLLEQFKKVMMQEFAMIDLGETKYFLGLEVQQLSKGIFICQRKYALDILKKFEMENCKPVATPLVQNEKLSKDDQETKVDSSYYRSLIGSLLYLTATRLDLMFAASYLSRFMSTPSKFHLVAAKRVLRYIKGTYELGLWFDSNQQGRLQGYADSDWAGSMEDMISTTSYVFSFGSGSFSWNSKKQDIVAQSTAKAEYLAAGAAANHAIWLRMVLEKLGFDQIEPCVLKVDNMLAITIAQNPVQHGRTKHIKIKYHVIRNYVRDKEIVLQHCDSEVQVADILTKALPR